MTGGAGFRSSVIAGPRAAPCARRMAAPILPGWLTLRHPAIGPRESRDNATALAKARDQVGDNRR